MAQLSRRGRLALVAGLALDDRDASSCALVRATGPAQASIPAAIA